MIINKLYNIKQIMDNNNEIGLSQPEIIIKLV